MQADAFKERAKRLKEVNAVIEKLDPTIRAAAFPLLSDYVTGHATKAKPTGAHQDTDSESPDTDTSEFFTKHPADTPAKNVVLIAAHLYSMYGAQPFRLDDIRQTADSVGMTIPTVLDMTLKQTRRDGKTLFQHAGRSQYKPTVHGELYLKKTYGVTKGTKQRPVAGNES